MVQGTTKMQNTQIIYTNRGRFFLLGLSPWFGPEGLCVPNPARKSVVTFRAVTHFPLEWFSWRKLSFLAKIRGFQGKLPGHTNFPLWNLKWLLSTQKPCEVQGAFGSWQAKRQLYFGSLQMELLWKVLPTKFPCSTFHPNLVSEEGGCLFSYARIFHEQKRFSFQATASSANPFCFPHQHLTFQWTVGHR